MQLHDAYLGVIEDCETKSEARAAEARFYMDMSRLFVTLVMDVMLQDLQGFQKLQFGIALDDGGPEPVSIQDKIYSRDH